MSRLFIFVRELLNFMYERIITFTGISYPILKIMSVVTTVSRTEGSQGEGEGNSLEGTARASAIDRWGSSLYANTNESTKGWLS